MKKYETLFVECGITDSELQNNLVQFLIGDSQIEDFDPSFIDQINSDKQIQSFLEKAGDQELDLDQNLKQFIKLVAEEIHNNFEKTSK